MSRAPSKPRRWQRSRNSSVIGWGNLGAPPNPPQVVSNAPRSPSNAWRSVPVSSWPSPSPPRAAGLGGQHLHDLVALAAGVVAPPGPGVGDRGQHPAEAGHARPVGLRVVGAGVERAPLGGEEHRHRPAAVPGHGLDRVHVDAVQVGPLLAVDLDADEALVHLGGRLGVLERLMGHHVAPVAGRVADREQDRLVLGPGPLQGLGAPRVPVDRVVGVLEEVGAGLARSDGSRPAGSLIGSV